MRYLYSHVHCSIIHSSKDTETTYVSVDRWEWIKKMCIYIFHCVCVCMCVSFSLIKEGNLGICDNMDEPGGHFVKRNKPDTERQILHDITDMWNLKMLNT